MTNKDFSFERLERNIEKALKKYHGLTKLNEEGLLKNE